MHPPAILAGFHQPGLAQSGKINCRHRSFFDPAKANGSDAEILLLFRQVQDEIKREFEACAASRRDALKAEN